MSTTNVKRLIKFPGRLPVLHTVQEVHDCPGHMLSSESDTAHRDTELLINMHSQLASRLLWCLSSLHTVLTFSSVCLIGISHLLPLTLRNHNAPDFGQVTASLFSFVH